MDKAEIKAQIRRCNQALELCRQKRTAEAMRATPSERLAETLALCDWGAALQQMSEQQRRHLAKDEIAAYARIWERLGKAHQAKQPA